MLRSLVGSEMCIRDRLWGWSELHATQSLETLGSVWEMHYFLQDDVCQSSALFLRLFGRCSTFCRTIFAKVKHLKTCHLGRCTTFYRTMFAKVVHFFEAPGTRGGFLCGSRLWGWSELHATQSLKTLGPIWDMLYFLQDDICKNNALFLRLFGRCTTFCRTMFAKVVHFFGDFLRGALLSAGRHLQK